MDKVQLSGSEKRALILWVLAGIVGLWYAQRHFFEAFPEASINFKVTRAEALERAKQFVESLGNSTAGYRSAIVFGVDDNAKTYLERQVGLKEANRLMASEVNVWHWTVRFFKPEQEEEFQIGVNPEGIITGYVHKVPEAQAGAEPTRDAAQHTAQSFLTAKLHKAAPDWDFLPEQVNSTRKPNRLDWSFTWEKHGFKAKDAPERLTIALIGADVGSAHEALKVPEQWERDYRTLRSTNEFYNTVAVVPYVLIFGAALWYGIRLTQSGQTSWRLALQLGVVVAVLLTAMQLNKWPVELIGYDTNSSYGSFAIEQVLGALLFGIGSALMVTLVLPGGEPFYREARPQLLRLKKALTWRGLRTKEFFSSVVVGLSLAGAHMGFLVAFYLIANRFGAWAPQEIKYDASLSTAIPWVSGIAIGLLAATSEEFLFRLFAIPFLQKLTKSRILAVILPAFSWGFLHAAYPNEPPYIRGLEVGLIGIAAGVVMLRWGILATLVWHYTVDAALVGLLLIRSSSWYFRISGIVVGLAILIPFSYAVYSRVRRGTFEEDEDLQNQAADPEDTVVREVASARELSKAPTGPLSKGVLALLAVCVLLGAVAVVKLKPAHLGDYLRVPVDAKQAATRAGEVLQQRGVDRQNYKSVTTFANVTDPTVNEYLRQKLGIDAMNRIYDKEVPGALWVTRFFREGQAEEYTVVLRPDGALHSVHHDVAEAAAGASLSKEEAIAKATAYLASEKKMDLKKWKLVDSGSEKRPVRVDHTLIWEMNSPVGQGASAPLDWNSVQAYQRVQVSVRGDEVTNYRAFIKIPDEWRRQQERESIWRTLHSYFVALLALAVGSAALVFFLREIRSEVMKQVPWRRFVYWGLLVLAVFVVKTLSDNVIPRLLGGRYDTSVPLKFIYGGLLIGFAIGGLLYMGLVAALFGMGWFFLKQAYGDVDWPGWSGMPRAYYRDALLIGIGGTAAFAAIGRMTDWISRHWPTPHHAFPAGFGPDFDALFPGFAISAGAVLHGLMLTATIAALAGFILAHCKSRWLRALMFAAASLAMVGNWGSPADFAKQWLTQVVLLGAAVLGVSLVARMNLLGYFLVLAIPNLILGAQEMLSQPNAFYHQQGYIVLAALAALLLWPLAGWLAGSERPPQQTPAA